MTAVYREAASHLFWEDLGGVLRLHLLPQWPCAASSASPEDLILARSPEYSLTNHRTHSWTYSHLQCASEIQLPIEFSCLPSDLFILSLLQGIFPTWDQTQVSRIAGRFSTI